MARVVLVGPRPGARGGIAQFVTHLRRALIPVAEVGWISFARLYPARTGPGRGESVTDPPDAPPSDPVLIAWRPSTWRAAARRLRDLQPDVVVLQWWHPAFAPALRAVARAARAAGARVVFVCHNAVPHERFPLARWLTRRALGEADSLVALSASVRDELTKLLPRTEVAVMPHPAYSFEPTGESRAAWRERLGTAGPVVTFFGYVRPYKGLADLIAAMPAVRLTHPRAVLAVAGPFQEPVERYEEAARAAGVEDAVRLFPGYVPDGEVGGLLAESDVVVLPYRSASQSGVLPQAVAAGIPVVATDVGGLAEGLNGAGIVVPPADPAALARGIDLALRQGRATTSRPEGDWGLWPAALLHPSPAAVRPEPPRSLLRLALRVTGAGIVALFMLRVLSEGLYGLQGSDVSFAWLPALASTGLLVAANALDLAGWHHLLVAAGVRLPAARGAHLYTSAGLVRFIPGGVLHLMARWRLAQRHGASSDAALGVTLLDLGLRVGSGIALFLATAGWFLHLGGSRVLPALAVVAALPVALRPASVAFAARWFRRLLRQVPRASDPRVASTSVTRAAFWYGAGWLLRGAGFFILCRSIASVPSGFLVPAAGAFALAWVAGVAVPVAPGGLGIREAVGSALLAPYIGIPVAAVAMLASRVQSLLVEAGMAGGIALWDRVDAPRRLDTRAVGA
jgi:glycosyltransferase involved in cell wall biosynthesis